MKRLKSAVVGLGHQAIEDHIPGLKDSQFASLEAICDIDEEKLKEWQDKLKVPGFTNYKQLLDSTELDFVIAATPHDVYNGIFEERERVYRQLADRHQDRIVVFDNNRTIENATEEITDMLLTHLT